MMHDLYADNYPVRRQEALLRAAGRCENAVDGRRCTNRLGTFKISHARNPCFEQLYVHHVNDDPENPDAELIVLCASCHMKRHRKAGSNGKASPRKQGYKVISINQLLIYLAAAGFSVRPNEECRVSWRIGPFEAEATDPVDALVMALYWLSAEVGDLQRELERQRAECRRLTSIQSCKQQAEEQASVTCKFGDRPV
jgi:hypothetical protein